jgi:hypothetical protein
MGQNELATRVAATGIVIAAAQQSGEGWYGDCHRRQAYGMRVGMLLLTSAVVGLSTTWFLSW